MIRRQPLRAFTEIRQVTSVLSATVAECRLLQGKRGFRDGL